MAPASLPFICCFYHLIHIRWQKTIIEPTPIERSMVGLEAGQRVERCHHVLWHHDRFTRDDIDDHDIQRGFETMEIDPVCRLFLPTDQTTLKLYEHRVRVCYCVGQEPFFAGYAPDLPTAATWVALGVGQLVIPWGAA